jgi:hypothetical protein
MPVKRRWPRWYSPEISQISGICHRFVILVIVCPTHQDGFLLIKLSLISWKQRLSCDTLALIQVWTLVVFRHFYIGWVNSCNARQNRHGEHTNIAHLLQSLVQLHLLFWWPFLCHLCWKCCKNVAKTRKCCWFLATRPLSCGTQRGKICRDMSRNVTTCHEMSLHVMMSPQKCLPDTDMSQRHLTTCHMTCQEDTNFEA